MYRILIVDDEEIEREGVSFLLNKLAYPFKIYMESNGKSALEFLKKTEVDILCTDIEMPFMDGLELCEQVRKIYPNIFIVLLTAYSDFDYARRAIRVQVDEYLLKPVVIKEFRSIMDKVLGELEQRKQEIDRKRELVDSYKNADDASFKQVMNRIIAQIEQEIKTNADTVIFSSHPLIRSAIDIINREYAKDITLEDVARQLNVSKGYLSGLFKSETTISMMQYITLLRMNKAEHLLRNSSVRVGDIAEAVGYHDASYFGVQFRKLYGKTPAEFRNSARLKGEEKENKKE